MGFVVCWKPHVTFLIIRALYVFSASTYDVMSHLIPITCMSAEVVDGGRCLFILLFIYLFYFIFHLFICIFREGNGGGEGSTQREKRVCR